MFNKYPYTDIHELNLDWILEQIMKLDDTVKGYIAYNNLVFADPIEWSPLTFYKKNTIVLASNGDTYVSKEDVPAGFPLDGDKWQKIGNYNAQIQEVEEEIAELGTDIENITLEVNRLDETLNTISTHDHSAVAEIGCFDGITGSLNGAYCHNNKIYQYCSDPGISGHFEVFNMLTGMHESTIANANFYHGNDFTVLNNKVYCAPYDDGNNNGVNKIIVSDIGSNITSELNPFQGYEYDCLFNIEAITESKLLCGLRTYGDDRVEAAHFYTYDIFSGEVVSVNVNWNGFNSNVNWFPHPIIFKNGKLYLTASFENGIYTMTLTDNTLNVIEYNALAIYSPFGDSLVEIESVVNVPVFGNNYIIIGFYNRKGVHYCGWSTNGTSSISLVGRIEPNTDLTSVTLKYNDPDYLFELGTADKPFKKFYRALAACNSRIFTSKNINSILMPPTVEEDKIVVNGDVGLANDFIANEIELVRSKCICTGSVTMLGDLVVRANSELTLAGGGSTLKDIYVTASKYFDYIAVHTGYIRGTNCNISISSSNPSETLTGNIDGNSLLQLNRANRSSITIGGGTALLTPGLK